MRGRNDVAGIEFTFDDKPAAFADAQDAALCTFEFFVHCLTPRLQ
jgi:hypothetical protein